MSEDKGLPDAPSDGLSYARQNGVWDSTPMWRNLKVNANTLPTIVNAGDLLTLQAADGAQTALSMSAFGASGTNQVISYNAGNTAAAPSAYGGSLININARAYDGAAWSAGAARLQFQTVTSPWTPADHSTGIVFGTTPVGTTVMQDQVAIGPGLVIGPATAPTVPMALGDLNVAGRIMVNGAALATTSGVGEAPTDGLSYARHNAVWDNSPMFRNAKVNANSLPTIVNPGDLLTLQAADGAQTALSMSAFGATGANGPAGAPSHIISGDVLGGYTWRGYGATAYSASGVGRINCLALETFTDTAQGTQLQFLTNPANSTATLIQAALGPGLTLGAPTVPTGGMLYGDINATRIMVNGVAVSAGGEVVQIRHP